MRLFISRVGRVPLALRAPAFAAALATLAACADDRSVTSPSTQPNTPAAIAGDTATTADDTGITLTVDPQGTVYPDGNGIVLIYGTITCSRASDLRVPLLVRVQQKQPGRQVGDGYAETSVFCLTTNQQQWGAYVYPSSNYYDGGKALISISVIDAPSGVVPATASKTVRLVPFGQG